MFTLYCLRREMNLWNVNVRVSLFCDAEHKEASLGVAINGRLMPQSWADPKWWEVDTPAKAEAWFRRVDLDSIAYNHRGHARALAV